MTWCPSTSVSLAWQVALLAPDKKAASFPMGLSIFTQQFSKAHGGNMWFEQNPFELKPNIMQTSIRGKEIRATLLWAIKSAHWDKAKVIFKWHCVTYVSFIYMSQGNSPSKARNQKRAQINVVSFTDDCCLCLGKCDQNKCRKSCLGTQIRNLTKLASYCFQCWPDSSFRKYRDTVRRKELKRLRRAE